MRVSFLGISPRLPATALSLVTLAAMAAAGQSTLSPSIKAILNRGGEAIVGANKLELVVTDAKGRPISGARITLDIDMATMDMGTAHPRIVDNGNGTYTTTAPFSMAGPWKVTVHIDSPGEAPQSQTFEFQAGAGMGGMNMRGMGGRLGSWSMSKEGSGTSWLPESSPMFMKMLPRNGRYDISLMGYFTLNFTDSGGPRGEDKFTSNSMPMLMARRETGGGILAMNLMVSFDPIFNGEYGAPNLFQTGETAYGNKLVDTQHPHNLVSELTASYSHPIGAGVDAFVYGGPIGEPALGGPAFPHRPSGMEIPEAPISHHWFDSTHISSGVMTLGANTSQWQLEGSIFNGHEPGENRYLPQPIQLNSASTRLTYNPTKNLSFNTSYGYLNSPESTEPGDDQDRFTATGILSLPLPRRQNLSVTAYFARKWELGIQSDAKLVEATLFTGVDSLFVRWENVEETELPDVPPGSYTINKILFGDVHNFVRHDGFELGIGAYGGLYAFPSSLDPYYGRSPVTLGVFLRLRPSRM